MRPGAETQKKKLSTFKSEGNVSAAALRTRGNMESDAVAIPQASQVALEAQGVVFGWCRGN
jgi:hypothetical protein